MAVDYDQLAGEYEKRYAQYEYGGIERAVMVFAHGAARVLEVGCGTGHYLRLLAPHGAVGLDFSEQMLARAAGPRVRGRAEQLPFADAVFDRVYAINAFHHFADKAAFVAEAQRVLVPGGGLMVVGLDPHAGAIWWIYDYYPEARAIDCARYPAAEALCELTRAAGFARSEWREVQHIASRDLARAALDAGRLAQATTSQLALMSPADYQAGIDRLRRAIAESESRGEPLYLETSLHIHAVMAFRD